MGGVLRIADDALVFMEFFLSERWITVSVSNNYSQLLVYCKHQLSIVYIRVASLLS